MSNPQFYVAANAWFYGNKRPSYKSLSNSYSAISRVRYDNTERGYRITGQDSHSYTIPPAYVVPPSTNNLVYAPRVIKPIYSQSLDDSKLNFYR